MRISAVLPLACIVALTAPIPALAKATRPAEKPAEAKPVPRGIGVALDHVPQQAGKGHGADVPRNNPKGKGYGFGHILHDHDAPASN